MTNDADVAEPVSAEMLRRRFEALVLKSGGPSKAARELDVSRTTLDQWVKGKARIPLEPAVKLAVSAGLSLDWLIDDSRVAPLVEPEPTTEGEEGFIRVPMLSVRASAGTGRIAADVDHEAEGIVSFREDWLRGIGLIPGRAEAMAAVGDSMEPTIRDGDLLLVDRSIDRVVNHGIYVLVYNGVVLVKRIQMRLDGSLVLKSDNDRYNEETVPATDATELIIEGRVRWFGRMI